MKKIIVSAVLAATIIACNSAGSSSGSSNVTALENEEQKVGYAYGLNIGQQVEQFSTSLKEDSLNYSELEKGIWAYLNNKDKNRDSYAHGQSIGLSIQNFIKTQKLEGVVDEKYIVAGVMDVLNKKELKFSKDSIGVFMNDFLMKNRDRISAANQDKGKEFLTKKKADSKVQTTASGLMYEVITEGTGAQPTEANMVKVNYKGQLIDGKVFDESPKGEPVEFPVGMVIQGWKEGLQLMKVGSKYKFYIPAELAYGMNGTPDGKIGPNEVLEFEVELLEVSEAPAQQQGQPGQQMELTEEQIKAMMQQAQAGQ